MSFACVNGGPAAARLQSRQVPRAPSIHHYVGSTRPMSSRDGGKVEPNRAAGSRWLKRRRPRAIACLLEGKRHAAGDSGTALNTRQQSGDVAVDSPQQLPSPAPIGGYNVAVIGPLLRLWTSVPTRYKLTVASMLSFVLCNMDKVNISVALVPIAQDFGWSGSVSGFVASAFFYGYLLAQIPGGAWTVKRGGRTTLPLAVALFSLATAAAPFTSSLVGFCAGRAAVGLGEAIVPTAAIDMVAKTVPKEERSRAVSAAFVGLPVGSVIGYSLSPVILHSLNWQAIFLSFGAMGLAWCLWFEQLLAGVGQQDPEFMRQISSAREDSKELEVPWRALLRCSSVRTLMCTHFCYNWLHYTMLMWLPTYYTFTQKTDIGHASTISLLPSLASIAASMVAGQTADALIAHGWPVPVVRKLAQGLAFLAPSACLLAAALSPNNSNDAMYITLALGLSSFSLAGLYCTHQDLSPKYSSGMMGLTNAAGAIPGIVGVPLVGIMHDLTGDWALSLLYPSVFCLTVGAIVYLSRSTHDAIDFDREYSNEPFAFEGRLQHYTDKVGAYLFPLGSLTSQWLKPLTSKVNAAAEKLTGVAEGFQSLVSKLRQ